MLGSDLNLDGYLDHLKQTIHELDRDAIRRWSDRIYETWEAKRFVFVFGNGGAGSTASHFQEDLAKSSLRPEDLLDDSRQRIKILSLNDNVGWITAIGNDMGFEHIFQQQLMNYASRGDLVIAMSGSGNSPNVIQAVKWAKQKGLHTFCLTGFDGGQLRQLQDDGLHVPVRDMGIAQSLHLCVFHWVLDDVYARINKEGRHALDP